MSRSPHLHPDTMLSIRLSAALTRDQYTRSPQHVIDELHDLAAGRPDKLHREVGGWIGYYGIDENRVLTDALLDAFPAAVSYVQDGRERREKRMHDTYGKR